MSVVRYFVLDYFTVLYIVVLFISSGISFFRMLVPPFFIYVGMYFVVGLFLYLFR